MDNENSEGLPLKPLLALSGVVALRALAVVLVLVAFVCTLLWSDLPTGETLGRASAAILLGLLLAGVSLLLPGRPRSARFFNVFLGVAAVFSAIGLANDVSRRAASVSSNPPQLQAEIDARLRAIFTSATASAGPHIAQQADVDGLRWAESKSVGSSARFYRIVADAEAASLRRGSLERASTLKAQLAPLELRSFPANASHLGDRAQLDATATSLRALHDSLAEELARSETNLQEVEQRLRSEAANPDLATGYVKGRLAANDSERRVLAIVDAHLEALTALQKAWGNWQYNPRAGSFSFSVSAEQAAFEVAFDKFRHAINGGALRPQTE